MIKKVIKDKRGISLRKSEDILFLSVFICFVLIIALKISYAASLNCSIVSSNSCNSPNITILYMQNDTGGYENAHAQNITNTTFARYNYTVCCSSNQTLGRDCSESTFLRISNDTSAHVQVGNYSGATVYSIPMCFSVGLGKMQCSYSNDNCPTGYTCVGSIASSESADVNITNSHFGSCNHYRNKICCKAGNSAPVVSLISPSNGNSTTNRRPTFVWNATDDDGDALTYQINITAKAYTGSPVTICSDNVLATVDDGSLNYTPTYDLKCLWDNGYEYNWSVRANDGVLLSNWSASFTLNISALIDIRLNISLINFSLMGLNDKDNTTDNSPQPFVIQNDGNSFAHINISATNLFETVSNPSSYYQFKIGNNTVYTPNENGSFNWSGSVTTFTNMPNSATRLFAISYLNYSNATDSARVDVLIQVPSSEPPGSRNSTVTFYAILGE